MKAGNFPRIFLSVLLILGSLSLSKAAVADTTHFTGVKLTITWCNYAGKVTIEGVNAIDGEDEIGVFVRNGAGEILIGMAMMGEVVSEHYFVNVYGDDVANDSKDGAENREELIFKVWDKSEAQEYTIRSTASMSYEADEFLTQPSIPPIWTNLPTFGLLNLAVSEKDIITPGDIDGDGLVDVKDVIMALRIATGLDPEGTIHMDTQACNESRIGVKEAVCLLQIISEEENKEPETPGY